MTRRRNLVPHHSRWTGDAITQFRMHRVSWSLTLQYFPERRHTDAGLYARAYFQHLATAAGTVDSVALEASAQLLADRSVAGKMIFSCGNGGSAAIANHLVCDCVKGVRASSTLRPRVHSLSTTVEMITAIGNDIGYEQIFGFQLDALGQQGDVLVAISSSGDSPNIINALTRAREMNITSIAMTGFSGGRAKALADISLHVDAHNYGVVEDVHQSLMHILAQYLRHSHLEDEGELGRIKF